MANDGIIGRRSAVAQSAWQRLVPAAGLIVLLWLMIAWAVALP